MISMSIDRLIMKIRIKPNGIKDIFVSKAYHCHLAVVTKSHKHITSLNMLGHPVYWRLNTVFTDVFYAKLVPTLLLYIVPCLCSPFHHCFHNTGFRRFLKVIKTTNPRKRDMLKGEFDAHPIIILGLLYCWLSWALFCLTALTFTFVRIFSSCHKDYKRVLKYAINSSGGMTGFSRRKYFIQGASS